MTTGKALASVSFKSYTVYTISMVVGCIILTTIIYKMQGGPKLLPMISDTWVAPPGSYLSRWILGMGAGLFAVMNIGLYFIENAIGGDTFANPKTILTVALVGTFLISWVAAICENDKPTCMGNAAIHDFCATGFFVLYDISMLLTYTNRRRRAAVRKWSFSMIMVLQSLALTLIMVVWKFLLPDESADTALALVEWTNVSIVGVLTIHCVFTAKGVTTYGVGFIETSAASLATVRGKDVSLTCCVSAYDVSLACVILYLSTLAVSCVAGLYLGYLPKVEGELWMISDMWVNIPGDWISRWGGIQGSHMGFLMQMCLFSVTASKTRQASLIISEIAIFGLSIVSVCDEDENLNIHLSGAFAYFVGYDVFVLMTLYDNYWRIDNNKDTREYAWIRLSFLLGTVVVVSHLLRLSAAGKIGETLAAILEWTNALGIIAFAFADVRAHSDCAGHVFGIFHQAIIDDKSILGTYELMTTESALEFPRDVKTLMFV